MLTWEIRIEFNPGDYDMYEIENAISEIIGKTTCGSGYCLSTGNRDLDYRIKKDKKEVDKKVRKILKHLDQIDIEYELEVGTERKTYFSTMVKKPK